MMNTRNARASSLFSRTVGALLALVLALLLIPSAPRARAASWVDPYLDQVSAWGVMKGDADGNLHPERNITRAEFVTMMNRAFGFTEEGPNPFTDVPDNAWYRQGICIAHKAGYFGGTSASTASPQSNITREQAVVMLGRTLRIQDQPGVSTRFQDNTKISHWARGSVQGAADMGIIGGFPDGTFRPQDPITRGQTAAMLVAALGNLVNHPGTYELGGIYGNLTITTPEAELKNTIVTGNLYLTGGIGLESLTLENVTVLGEIIICGAGSSQKGDSSVILRNVNAGGLVVDTLQDYPVSLRAEGLTEIDQSTIRSSAFLEDMTGKDLGLGLIQMEGNRKVDLKLAGNIKEVINRAPTSNLVIAQGTAQKITMDEHALDSQLRVDRYVNVGETNLDIPTEVVGQGSLGHVNVSAPDCTVEMLPDTIVVRPGINADVAGEDMDSVAAEESSEDPRILGGYPDIRNVSPRSADAVFSTNKKGTLHWALTAMADGSLSAEELLNPESIAHKVIKSGTVDVKFSRVEQVVKLSGLTKDGSYYVSAVLTDNRGRHSQVKVAGLTTPDDSVPAFANGYPQPIITKDKDNRIVVQTRVMATKSCRLYYALMPKGSVAPTPADFRAAALTGTLGWGQMDVIKNTPHLIARVNDATLKEKTDYDLYLMLSDVDNGKNSPVKKLSITTPDVTPPVLQRLSVTDQKATSVSMSFQVDEPATLYWAVTPMDKPLYPPNREPTLDDLIHVENGVGALVKGSAAASPKTLEGKFVINGLKPQTTYLLYYVTKDTAGNYGVYSSALKPPIEIQTLDTEPPTVTQKFIPKDPPYSDTSIRLIFSERVRGVVDEGGTITYHNFLDCYQEKDFNKLSAYLSAHIRLKRVDLMGNVETVPVRDSSNPTPTDWLVDFRKARIEVNTSTGQMTIVLPYDHDASKSALNLASGTTYFFELENIADMATPHNIMVSTTGVVQLDEFKTIDAQMFFSLDELKNTYLPAPGAEPQKVEFDMSFKIDPVSASSVDDALVWDLLFWSKDDMEIEVFTKSKSDPHYVSLGTAVFNTTDNDPEVALSFTAEFKSPDKSSPLFEKLNQVKEERQYGIIVRKYHGSDFSKRSEWSGSADIEVMAVSGIQSSLSNLVNSSLTPKEFDEFINNSKSGSVNHKLGVPEKFPINKNFRDQVPPTFRDGYPTFTAGDSGVDMSILVNRKKATYFYVITEVGNIPTTLTPNNYNITADTQIVKSRNSWSKLPASGDELKGPHITQGNVSAPVPSDITRPTYQGHYITGYGSTDGGVKSISIKQKLKAETMYVAYFVLQGESPESISNVYAFRFETEKVVRPVLKVSPVDLSTVTVTSTDQNGNIREADINSMLIVAGSQGPIFSQHMGDAGVWDPQAEAAADGILPGNPNDRKELIRRYKSMDLLQAMATPHVYGKNMGSVFDLFASDTIKNSVASFFNSPVTSSGIVKPLGTESLTAPTCAKTIQCKKFMNPDGKEKYWFVTMGSSPLGSGDAFAAYSLLEWPDPRLLYVNHISTTTKTNLTKDPNLAATKAYSGTVTITFSEPLYINAGSTTSPIKKQVVDIPVSQVPGLMGNYYSSVSLIQGIPGINVSVDPQNAGKSDLEMRQECSVLILNYTGLTPGTAFNFDPKLCTSQGSTSSTLILELGLEQPVKDGQFRPVFRISPASSEWDHTGKK